MPNYYNPPYQTYQQPQYRPQQPNRPRGNIIRVMGPESAMAYPMGPAEDMVFFDANNPTFYQVSTDDSGFKTMRIFDDFKERVQQQDTQMDTSKFATKDDITEIKTDIAKLTEALKGLV